MFFHQTTFIIGAGASFPYGLPLGPGLRNLILRDLKKEYFEQLRAVSSVDEISRFEQGLKYSGFSSVDGFLARNPEFLDVGKAAIAIALGKIENERKLFSPHCPKDHWMEVLLQMMDAPTWGRFKANKVNFITFNYDRILEHYLSKTLSQRFKISLRAAGRWLDERILHVHGSLGSYRGELASERFDLETAVDSLIVLPEADTDSDQFREARKTLVVSDAVVFLGFGYHWESMGRLDVKNIRTFRPALVVGTHVQIERGRWAKIIVENKFSRTAERRGSGKISNIFQAVERCTEERAPFWLRSINW